MLLWRMLWEAEAEHRNRPDLQFDYNNRRYYLEYDSPASGRGPGHQSRLTANHMDGETILIIIP